MNFSKKYVFLLGALFVLLPALCVAQTVNFNSSTDNSSVNNITSGCAPLTLYFKNTTSGVSGSPSWNWDLGNGNTSLSPDASATYSQPGTFTVKLFLNGGSPKTMIITVYDKPTVHFTVDIKEGCAPLNVQFTNNTTPGSGSAALTTYNWVFGDGGTSTAVSPPYTYETPAPSSPYSVTLMATNQYGCSNAGVSPSADRITVKGPLVNFGLPQTSFCSAPASVTFTNNTSGVAPLSYQWSFGDQTAVSSQPTHTYTSSGTFDVSLKATDGEGCFATLRKTAFVSVGNEPGVDFSLSSEKVCVGQAITVTNQTSVPVLSRLWDLGNGSQSSGINPPQVAYSEAGFYNITLKVTLPSGCEITVVKKVEVVFSAVPDFKTTAACNRKITFNNASQQAYSFLWNFGDGTTSLESNPVHTYAAAGTYRVKLTGYNTLNCPVSIEKDIQVNANPIAHILPDKDNSCTEPSLAGCAPFNLQFTNGTVSSLPLTTIAWTFGDANNNTSAVANPAHNYALAGTYQVMLVVTNSLSCRDTARAVVKVSATTPKADFSVNKTTVCVNEKVTFTNTSTSSDFWCWDFGDASTSNSRNPDHIYKEPGTYTVILVAKNAGCSNTITKTQLIKVNDPFLKFEVVKNCANPYDVFLSNSSRNFTDFVWDFGDGITNTNVISAAHHYQSTGEYKVKLTIKNPTTGCTVKDSARVVIQDIQSDFISASNPVCKNNPVAFTDQSQFAVAWSWDFKDGTNSSVQHPIKVFTTPGDYNVTLTVRDTDGCTDSKVMPVKVANIQGAFSFEATSNCDEFTVAFKDGSLASPAIQNWLWDFGDQVSSTEQHPVHVYNQQRSYPVRLTLQNAEATCSVLLTDAVVFTNPVPDFAAPKNAICVDEAITFLNKSTLAQTFLWDFGNTQTMTTPVPTMKYTAPGKYTVTLKATDQYGCEKSIVKTNFLEVLKPTADFEATQTSAECPPLITTFKDKSSGDVTKWSWNFGDGQSSVLRNPVNTYQVPGIYDVTLEVTNYAGCTTTFKVDDLVSLGGPYGDFAITSPYTCVNDAISFVATATHTTAYIWDFGDGTVLDTDKNEVTHVYSNSAPANLSLTLVDSKGCKVVVGKGKKVDVKGKPEVDFEFDPEYPFENEPVIFTASLKEELDLVWRFDEEVTPGTSVMEKTFDLYGTHHITLSGYNSDGCSGVMEKDIRVQGDLKMIPNVFTPNENDQLNSTFWVEDVEKGFWELRVYNRWGQQVFRGQEYKNDWEGNGLSTGVYYYQLTNMYRKSKEYKGYIQLIR